MAYALDLSKPGVPIKWRYDPHPDPAAIGKVCCDAVNRGPGLAGGRLVFTLLDGDVVALDTASGKPAWRVRIGDVNAGMTITMSPLVVGNLVLVGNSGGEMGTGNLFAAYMGKPLSNMAMTSPMSRAGHKAGPHGFRSTFRTWAEECTRADFETKEACLGHTVDTGVVGAFQRSDRLAKRRKLLEEWSNFLTNDS